MASYANDLRDIWSRVCEHAPHLENIAPRQESVFAAMSMPIHEVRVIILGQDPYPTPGTATGRAFEAAPGVHPRPPSLRNIAAEYNCDLGGTFDDGTIGRWAGDGVLMLNTILTTQAGSSLAHADCGWQAYTAHLISEVRARQPHVIGILWGRHAQMRAPLFDHRCLVQSAHPSPLSAHRGFFGSQPFTRANELLAARHLSPVDW